MKRSFFLIALWIAIIAATRCGAMSNTRRLISSGRVPVHHNVSPELVTTDSDKVPVIARILGVRVGFDTIERLEQLYGSGYAYTGGHPHGAREWRCRNVGWYIDSDGFDYRNHKPYGRVIDSISISNAPIIGGENIPRISMPSGKLRFMGVVALGMSHQEVLRLLRRKLPAPKTDGSDFIWKAKGDVRLNSMRTDDKYEWSVCLGFEQDRLVEISICS